MTAFYFWLCRSPRSHKAEYLETLAEVRAALDTAAPETPTDMSPINPSEGGE